MAEQEFIFESSFREFFSLAHDCRQEAMKDFVDAREWETWLLSQGLKQTIRSATTLNVKVKETYSDGTKKSVLRD